jgi:hypothetical protein
MKTKILKVFFSVLACLIAVAMCPVAAAFPSFGGSCLTCHSNPAGIMDITPDPINIEIGDSGLITFYIIALPGSESVISVSGLEDPDLDVTIGAASDNWIWTVGPNGSSYISDIITTTGPYTLDLEIGVASSEGLFGIDVLLVGSSLTGSSYDFYVNVIGEVSAAIPYANDKAASLWFAQIGPSPTNAEVHLILESSDSIGALDLEVFDIRGRRIAGHREVFSGRQFAWTWDGRTNSGRLVPAGVYWILAQSRTAVARERIVLVR